MLNVVKSFVKPNLRLRSLLYGKNDFAETSKNLVKYKSEDNSIGLLK